MLISGENAASPPKLQEYPESRAVGFPIAFALVSVVLVKNEKFSRREKMKNLFFFFGIVCVASSCGFSLRTVRDQYCHPANCGIQVRSIPEPPAHNVTDLEHLTGVYVGPFVRLCASGSECHYYAWHGDHYVRYHRELVAGKRVWTFRGD